jgi:hypothetical protein
MIYLQPLRLYLVGGRSLGSSLPSRGAHDMLYAVFFTDNAE